jgi:putative ferrous iron transport protein C
MILITLKQYLKQQRLVSMLELTQHFNVDSDIIRSMLQLFIRKGNVQKKTKTNLCGSKCAKCHPHMTELYEWVL